MAAPGTHLHPAGSAQPLGDARGSTQLLPELLPRSKTRVAVPEAKGLERPGWGLWAQQQQWVPMEPGAQGHRSQAGTCHNGQCDVWPGEIAVDSTMGFFPFLWT